METRQDDENLALWEGMAALHGGGLPGYYDVDSLVAGRNPIHDEVEAALQVATGARGVDGLDIIHVQSHVGIDSVELARRGARVTCTDFSPTALASARRLADTAGVRLDTVESDSTALPDSLHDRFDLAYATIGVICWIANLDAWMASVAACIRSGGALVLVDIHPLREMVDTMDPLVMDLSYTFKPGGLDFDEDGSYADPSAKLPATKGTCYAHSIGEIVTAAIGAGLRIEHLREHTESTFDASGDLKPDEDGVVRWRIAGGEPLPLYFGLVARKD